MKIRTTICPAIRRERQPVPALRARDRARPALRRARLAADRLLRLERRHGQGRRTGQGRKRLAGVLPVRSAAAVWPAGAPARGHGFCRALRRRGGQAAAEHRRHAWDGEWYRRAYFDDGTPLGSAAERGMPDRFDLAKLVGAVRRRRSGAFAHGDGCGRPAPGAARRPVDPAARSAVRQIGPESGLYQRLCARRARKRRPVHARGDLDARWRSPNWATASAPGNCCR